jgi:hypothetical protein
MARQSLPLTDELINDICDRVRAGAFEHVAAGALGVLPTTFDDWLRQGRKPRGNFLKRKLVHELNKAKAHARLMAETEMRKEDPKCWLLHGPGKETPAAPGWSALARALARSDQPESPLLQQAEFAGLARLLLRLLAPYPEARAAVAGGLTTLTDLSGTSDVLPDPAPPASTSTPSPAAQ